MEGAALISRQTGPSLRLRPADLTAAAVAALAAGLLGLYFSDAIASAWEGFISNGYLKLFVSGITLC